MVAAVRVDVGGGTPGSGTRRRGAAVVTRHEEAGSSCCDGGAEARPPTVPTGLARPKISLWARTWAVDAAQQLARSSLGMAGPHQARAAYLDIYTLRSKTCREKKKETYTI